MKIFKTSVLPLKHQLFRLAMGIVGSKDIALDVVQEVLIKIWEKRSEWQEIKNLEGYCMRMTRNLAIDKIRSRHHQTAGLHLVQHFATTTETPYDQAQTQDTFRLVRQIIAQLPQDQQTIFELRAFEGLSYAEIAKATNLSMSQVKVYLSRARLKIKNQLLKDYESNR